MKKLIILIGILGSTLSHADLIARMPMEDYVKTEFDYMYEVKTAKYQKVILDCQGFIMGLGFYFNDQMERKIYMDEETCQDVNQFLGDSKKNGEPVCLELNVNQNSITFSRKTTDCQ